MTRLDGKVALITGAASGMGRVACERFAAEGARIAALDLEAPEATVEAVRAAGGEAQALVADVSDETSITAAVAEAALAFGGIDILYNNAGISPGDDGDTTETPVSTWERTLDVNVKGSWLCVRAALEHLRASGHGSVINVASFVAFMGAATPQVAYTASKGAVLAMTREMAVCEAQRGVRVNALCPGPVLTPLLEKFLSDEAKRQRRLVHIPMGRFGTAEEMVNGALFLASDESSFMTGQALIIDGGITAAYVTPEAGA